MKKLKVLIEGKWYDVVKIDVERNLIQFYMEEGIKLTLKLNKSERFKWE